MPIETQFYITRDVQGQFTSGSKMCHPFSNNIEWIALTANTPASFTVPGVSTDFIVLEFSYSAGANVLVQPSASPTLAVPGSTPAAVVFELNPAIRQVRGGTVMQFLTTQSNMFLTVSMMQTVFGVGVAQ